MNAAPTPVPPAAHAALQWDIFCRVIDNFGDIGVCWRLASGLADRGQRVRLWTDDASALQWLAPQGHAGVQVRAWGGVLADDAPAAEVLIEAFGCEIAPEFIAAYARRAGTKGIKPLWINLEYLSAENYVERSHGLPCPVLSGPATGWTKWFFYPGFTPATGGLLREGDLLQRLARFDAAAWRSSHLATAARTAAPSVPGARWISLFCYEPQALPQLLEQCAGESTQLLVTPGRATAATHAALLQIEDQNGPGACRTWSVESENRPQRGQFLPDLQAHSPAMGQKDGEKWTAAADLQPTISNSDRLLECLSDMRKQLSISYLSPCPQAAFDEMLWACDLNLVRGEDSLVRALWSGRPLVWQIYPQHDNAHHDKLQAFLDWLQAPASLRQFHAVWNGVVDAPLPLLDAAMLQEWAQCVLSARARLLAQSDLLTQLLGFCGQKR